MQQQSWRRLALAGATVVLLAACGQSQEEREAEAAAEASASAEAKASARAEAKAEQEAKEREAALRAQQKCESQMTDLRDSLKEIDSRLDVGLSYDELGDYLGAASVAYDRVPIAKLEEPCVSKVGIPLEKAFNEYRESLTAWQKCIHDYYCSVEGAVLAGLRQHWSEASKLIMRADHGLRSKRLFLKHVQHTSL